MHGKVEMVFLFDFSISKDKKSLLLVTCVF